MRIRILQSCSMSVVVGIKSLSLVEYSDSGVASGVPGRGADCTGRHFLGGGKKDMHAVITMQLIVFITDTPRVTVT